MTASHEPVLLNGGERNAIAFDTPAQVDG